MSEAVKGRSWDSNRANFDRNLAVVIGIDHYKNPSIQNLSTAVSDAKAIAHLLEQEYAYKHSDEKPDVIRLFDKEATLGALQHLFHTRIPEELNPGEGDRLIIYYAGHGLPRSNDDGPEGYLVPHDADPTKPELFLAMRDVSAALSKLKCHHLLVILDCCFAGTFRWAGSRKAVPILETIRREHYYHFIRHPAWQVITSSAHDQEALDVARLKEDNRQPVPGLDQQHSPFALAILEGLQTRNDSPRANADMYPDGIVTAHELFVYLQNRVKELSGERQNPGIFPLRKEYDKGEFIFTRPEFDPQKLAEALLLNEDNNPYRGLNSFDEKHAAFFFGRQALIEELVKRLAKPNQALTVVLGVSGSGKSSLVKAGLLPHLRTPKSEKQAEQQPQQWYILGPMRPGELPFISLGRTLLPVVKPELLEQVARASFLDALFEPMLKAKTEAKQNSVSVPQDQQVQADETLMKVADSWCNATPEAKLLLIEDYFAQLKKLGSRQEKEQLKELYDRIRAELDAVGKNLQQDPQFFSRAISTWSQNHPGVRLLLVIDQFEELLTRSQDNRESPDQTEQQDGNRPIEQKEWQQFLEVLRIAIADHPQSLHLVLTLRSDFEPRFLPSALEPYWKDARFPVRAMTSDELRQVIENPALKQALYFEELKDEKGNTIGNLISKLVDEVGQMPGALPLLSFTLSELYVSLYRRWQDDRSTDRTLRFADYEALGGVAGALTRRATQEYDALDENRRATMRRVMLRMVAIEGGGVVRRRVPKSELVYSDPNEEERARQVVNLLINARLLVTGQQMGLPYLESAHDFLVRGWNELQKWIENEKDELALQQRLTTAANEWDSKIKRETEHKRLWDVWRRIEAAIIRRIQKHQFDQERQKNQKQNISKRRDEGSISYLWDDDPRLGQLKQILIIQNNWFNQVENRFIWESLVEKKRNTYRLIGVVTGVVLGLSGLTIAAIYQAKLSSLREQVAVARTLIATDPPKALILAAQAVNQASMTFPQVLSAAQSSLFVALESAREREVLRGHTGSVIAVAFSPNGQQIVSGGKDGTVRLWNLEGSFQILGTHTGPVTAVAFSPNGQQIVSGGKDGTVRLWNLEGSFQVLGTHTGSVTAVAFNPTDINSFISGGQDGIVKLWNFRGSSRVIGNREGSVRAIAVSRDGKTVAVGGDGDILRLWHLDQKNDQPIKLPASGFVTDDASVGCIVSVTFSTASPTVVIAGHTMQNYPIRETMTIWDLGRDNPLVPNRIKAHEFATYSVASSPDGDFIASSGDDGNLELRDLDGNLLYQPLPQLTQATKQTCSQEDSSSIHPIVISPDSQVIVIGGRDGTIRVWSAKAFPSPKSVQIYQSGDSDAFKTTSPIFEEFENNFIFFRSNGSSIELIKHNDTLEIREQENNESPFNPPKDNIQTFYSSDGKAIATVKNGKIIQVRDSQGVPIAKAFTVEDEVQYLALSLSQQRIAIVDVNNIIGVVDFDGRQVGKPFLHPGEVHGIALSPDGELIITANSVGLPQGGGDTVLRLWDIEGGYIISFRQVGALFNNCGRYCSVLAFSPSGRSILSYSYINYPSIKIWPGNWEVLLGIACNRSQKHPILNPPIDSIAKETQIICKSRLFDEKL